jgi:CMP-N,N'-diacetyllegionaminic acid synthase
MTNILAIVPARGGSKGIPMKNSRMCGGQPLMCWAIDAISQADIPYVISTDDTMFKFWPCAEMCDPIGDTDQIEDRLDPIIQHHNPSIIVLLQPTSPVRTGKQIDEAIEQLQREGADSLLSVVESHSFSWRKTESYESPHKDNWTGNYGYGVRPRRQDMSPRYEENGSIYVFTREHWERTHNRLGGKISLYVMPEESRIQVDSPFDLWMAGQILMRQEAPKIKVGSFVC